MLNDVAVTGTDFRDELKRIDLPALVVHGTADQSAPIDLTGRPTAKLLPQGELQVYPGAPHGVFLTHLERLNANLLRFLNPGSTSRSIEDLPGRRNHAGSDSKFLRPTHCPQ